MVGRLERDGRRGLSLPSPCIPAIHGSPAYRQAGDRGDRATFGCNLAGSLRFDFDERVRFFATLVLNRPAYGLGRVRDRSHASLSDGKRAESNFLGFYKLGIFL